MGLSVQTIIKELNTSIIYDPISEVLSNLDFKGI